MGSYFSSTDDGPVRIEFAMPQGEKARTRQAVAVELPLKEGPKLKALKEMLKAPDIMFQEVSFYGPATYVPDEEAMLTIVNQLKDGGPDTTEGAHRIEVKRLTLTLNFGKHGKHAKLTRPELVRLFAVHLLYLFDSFGVKFDTLIGAGGLTDDDVAKIETILQPYRTVQ
jgi:hypothetical protein